MPDENQSNNLDTNTDNSPTIPNTPDQSLSSTMSKGLTIPVQIPDAPDTSLSSNRTANEGDEINVIK